MKTKKQLIEQKIEDNIENIYNMEIVRDFQMTRDVPEAKVEVDAANAQIAKCEIQLTWLREYLKLQD